MYLLYLKITLVDPMFKYWDRVYSNSSRISLISEKEYDSGVN